MPLTANALTTVATCEDELGITADSETARLQRLINEATGIIEGYTGRTFHHDSAVSEDVVGDEGPYLFVTKTPINSITSVSYLGSALSTDDYELHDAYGGTIYALDGSWFRLGVNFNDISQTMAYGMSRKVYTVAYDGGYFTPQQETNGDGTRTLPYDLERACIMLVSYLRRNMGRDTSIVSESLLGASVSYANPGTGHWLNSTLPGAAFILNNYKVPILR